MKIENGFKCETENNTSDNSGDNKGPNMNTTTISKTAVPMGDGFWRILHDDNDCLLQRDTVDGKVEILFSDNCLSAAWKGVSSALENTTMDAWMPEIVAQALSRYERIMWMSRPPLSFGEAKLIALALFNNHVFIDTIKVGLKEQLFITLSDCEMEHPCLYEMCGVNQSELLAKVDSMTQIEIFSIIHSAEAFSCGDHSDKSLETYFNIARSGDANDARGNECDKSLAAAKEDCSKTAQQSEENGVE